MLAQKAGWSERLLSAVLDGLVVHFSGSAGGWASIRTHNKEERITAIITSDFIATTLTYIHSINVYCEGIIYTLVASVVVVTGRGGDFAGVVGSTPPLPPHEHLSTAHVSLRLRDNRCRRHVWLVAAASTWPQLARPGAACCRCLVVPAVVLRAAWSIFSREDQPPSTHLLTPTWI